MLVLYAKRIMHIEQIKRQQFADENDNATAIC